MEDILNPWEAIWTIINFAIFAFLLGRFFFKPVIALLDERRATIQASLDEARRAREEAEAARTEYDQRLAEARREAQEIIERAENLAEKERQERLAAAQKEAEELLERARQTIAREREEAIAALRAEVADLTVLAAERILRKQLNRNEQRRLAEEALREVSRIQ
ncbi:MAG TPA: F0F1 ATP synthase subunit B [Bacillota bacterium]